MPFASDGIATDMIAMPNEKPDQDLTFLADELCDPYDFGGMPIVSPEALIAMKLVAHRRQDKDDTVPRGARVERAPRARC
ncbi:MAG: hypothetical protein EXR73_06545 [Myxococcales bacterium]|nr:hypothetical protein [Myxococcales bacterium]